MAGNIFALLEMQSPDNGPIVSVSLFHIVVPCCQVGCEEAKAGIMVVEPYSNSAFVARHSP